MRLFEAIVNANHRALAGDPKAGLHPADFADALPLVALTCIDVRLNPLMPEVLGIPKEQFVWLRNAGNVITGPHSSTLRSLSLACAIKGGQEIAIIGHTDCQVGKTTTMELLERFRALGVERHLLPENLNEFFGTFASERANAIKAVDIVRHSPLIGPRIPVHGLLVVIETGKLEWLVNGYQALETMNSRPGELMGSLGKTIQAFAPLTDFVLGEMKFPETKIGELATQAQDWLSEKIHSTGAKAPASPPNASPAVPPKIALPLQVKPKLHFRKV